MARLIIKDENGVERVHELTDDVTSIGRSSNNTIKITDAKSSRNHFRVEKDGEFFKVVDLGSTNGTKVNGVRVTSQRLRKGDVLALGLTTFTYDGPSDGAYDATVKFDPEGQAAAAAAAAAAAPKRASSPEMNASAPSTAATPAPSVETAVTVPSHSIDTKAIAAMQAKAGEGPKYVLAIIEGKEAGRTIDLGNDAVTLGRSSSNTIKIDDDAASSYHAEITKAPIGYVISDLGSTNGTRVKARSAAEFEKIVKTPLAPGMQIRIGKTVIEFRNVGASAGEDQLFGTVVLSEGGEGQLAGAGIADRPARKSGSPLVVIGLAAVVFFVAVVYIVVKLIPEAPTEPKPPVVPPKQQAQTGEVENGDFSQGTDDRGNPKGWKPNPGLPEVRVVVDKEAERNADQPDEKRMGLRISKAGASPSTRTTVETMDTLSVEPGKVYEVSGAMKNDGDGQFGLRVVWIKGDRALADHPLTLSGTQQAWKDRSAKIKPPPWADRARVGVFTEGREGKTYFDNIAFKQLAESEKLPDPPSVSYGGITVNFEGGKGAFSVTSGGQGAIEGALLELASKDGQAVSSLLSAFETQPVAEGGKTTYRGQIFDFQLQHPTNYLISAQAGSGGVQMRFAVDRSQGDSAPRLVFFVTGPAAKGDLDARLDGGPQKLASTESKTLSGLQEILFNSGGTPQLYLNFAAPVTLETRREGERRWVQVAFQGELGVEIAPENVGEKQQFANASKDLDDALSKKDWSRVYKLCDTIDQKYGKMLEAKDKARQARAAFDDAFKAVKEDLVRQIDTVKQAPTTAADALKSIDRQMGPWIGTSKEQDFRDAKQQIEKLKTAGANQVKEEAAAQALKSAQTSFNKGVYTVAISFCNKILRDFPDTQAAKEAKDLLAKADEAQKKEDELSAITAGLKKQVEAFVKAGDYAEAIKTITNSAEYKKHSTQLKEINELLEAWRAKAGQ